MTASFYAVIIPYSFNFTHHYLSRIFVFSFSSFFLHFPGTFSTLPEFSLRLLGALGYGMSNVFLGHQCSHAQFCTASCSSSWLLSTCFYFVTVPRKSYSLTHWHTQFNLFYFFSLYLKATSSQRGCHQGAV